MQQVAQAHNQYLIDVAIILGVALLNKARFFQAINDFDQEREQLVKEQAQDLAVTVLDWWEPTPMTEVQYFNQLAEANGELS